MAKHFIPAYQSARCTVCNHPSRPEIDRALIDGVPSAPWPPPMASALGPLSHTRHLRQQLVIQQRQADQSHVSAFLEKLELLEVRLDRLFRKAEESRSLHVSLGCLQESIRILSLREKFRHSLGDRLRGKMSRPLAVSGPTCFLSVPLPGCSIGDIKRQSRGLRHKRHRF